MLPLEVVLPLDVVAPLDVELLEVEVSIPPLDVELVLVVAPLEDVVVPLDVELLDDVDVFTGFVVTSPPPSGVPVPSPLPPEDVEEDVDDVDVVVPVEAEPPTVPLTGSLPRASVIGGWSSVDAP